MYDTNSKGISYTAGFFILIGFTIAAFFAAALISIPIWTGMTGQSIMNMEKDMTNPEYSDAIKIIQTITAVVGFLMPAIFSALLLNRKPFRLLGFAGRIKISQVGITLLIVFFSMFVSAALAYFNEMIPLTDKLKIFFDKLEKDYNDQVEAIITLNNFTDYIIAVGIMAFIPAVCEEALFRGGLQNFLTRSTKTPWLSIIIISLIFSAVHFSFYGFLSRFFLGIMLGLIFHYSGKLWLSILAHFINNLIAVTAIYILTQQGKSLEEAIAETGGTPWYIVALPVVVILFFWFYRVSKKEKEVVEATAPVQNDPGDLFC
jgi:membrane protease YdiL (CAAX protease family)